MNPVFQTIKFGPFVAEYHQTAVDLGFKESLNRFLEQELLPQVDGPFDSTEGKLVAEYNEDRYCGPNSAVRDAYRLKFRFIRPYGSDELDAQIYREKAGSFRLRYKGASLVLCTKYSKEFLRNQKFDLIYKGPFSETGMWIGAIHGGLFDSYSINFKELFRIGVTRGEYDDEDVEQASEDGRRDVTLVGYPVSKKQPMSDWQNEAQNIITTKPDSLQNSLVEVIEQFRLTQDHYFDKETAIDECIQLDDLHVGKNPEDGIIASFYCDWNDEGNFNTHFRYTLDGVEHLSYSDLDKVDDKALLNKSTLSISTKNMDISEFKKDGSYDDFDIYELKDKIPTNIGKFKAELQMDGRGDVDEKMISLLEELVDYGVENSGKIQELVHGNYLEACNNDPEWVEDCDVPLGVGVEKIMKHLEHKAFCVREDPEIPEGYDSFIHITPLWDEEHSLYIRYTNSSFEVFDPMSG